MGWVNFEVNLATKRISCESIIAKNLCLGKEKFGSVGKKEYVLLLVFFFLETERKTKQLFNRQIISIIEDL